MSIEIPSEQERLTRRQGGDCEWCGHGEHDFETLARWCLPTQVAALRAQKDNAYDERNKCVVAMARMAHALGCDVGVGRHVGDDWEDDWRSILFIDLPTGQVSWHFHDSELELLADLPRYVAPWDGHSTSEKYHRLLRQRWESA